MSDIKTALLPLLEEEGGILLDVENALVLLDPFARRAVPLPVSIDESVMPESVTAGVTEFLRQQNPKVLDKQPAVTIHISVEDIYASPALRRGVPTLMEGLSGLKSVDIRYEFSRSPADWLPLLRWHTNLAAQRDGNLINCVTVSGPFSPLNDEVKEWFSRFGARLCFTLGWWRGCSPAPNLDRDFETMRDLARYGFRVPLVCYVHADNVRTAASILQTVLTTNQYSGFALPLVSCHLHYDFSSGQPALPDAEEYLELLVSTYQEYPHYDDVFYPIQELTELVRDGGWSGAAGLPARLRLLARAKGVTAFRQTPALAKSCVDWDSLEGIKSEEILPALLEFHREAFAWEQNPFCGRCGWRHLCGGLDDHADELRRSASAAEVTCNHRKFFLEILLRQVYSDR